MPHFRCLILICVLLLAGAPAWGSMLKADEQVLLFAVDGAFDQKAGGWRVPVHAWVFELEPESLWRGMVLTELQQALGLPPTSVENLLFRSRAAWFLADSESGKYLAVQGGKMSIELGPTSGNGHARQEFFVPEAAPSGEAPRGLELTVIGASDRFFSGRAFLVPPRGISIVSDVDDTIKFSQVDNKEALLANTFLRPFRAVAGMADAYRRWAAEGAAFHYLSASPWQLYPTIEEFLVTGNFPPGSLQLRDFRLNDQSFFNMFQTPREYKLPALAALLARFPARRFVLVGDAGEEDPEIYAEIASRFPGQVAAVFIRETEGAQDTGGRCERLFGSLPVWWQVFRSGDELPGLALPERELDARAGLGQ